ncbi:MAG TPA: c-type cytochrome [Longimicrobiaceae bacterium]|nr:c-type cytochrome [Longimicrobiaceae bacterium]
MTRARVRRGLAAGVLLCVVGGCIRGEGERAVAVAGGDPGRGRELVHEYACGGCHVIPGVAAASSLAGPPLTDWAERQYVAGALWNTPDNLIRWIMDPQAVEPGTAMPDLGVTEEEARHMAAYLFTLGDVYGLGPPHPFPKRWLEKLGAKNREPTPWSAPVDPEYPPGEEK